MRDRGVTQMQNVVDTQIIEGAMIDKIVIEGTHIIAKSNKAECSRSE